MRTLKVWFPLLMAVLLTGGFGIAQQRNGRSPVVRALPANAVTTDTVQTISGAKTFSSVITSSVPSGCAVTVTGGARRCDSDGRYDFFSTTTGDWSYPFGGASVVGTISTTLASGDGVSVAGGAYVRADKSFAGAPTAADCDAAGEKGRISIDTTGRRFCWCEGAAGWRCATSVAP